MDNVLLLANVGFVSYGMFRRLQRLEYDYLTFTFVKTILISYLWKYI